MIWDGATKLDILLPLEELYRLRFAPAHFITEIGFCLLRTSPTPHISSMGHDWGGGGGGRDEQTGLLKHY